MSLTEFIKMKMLDRAEIVVDKGILVDSYLDKGLGLQIYYFGGFFVEISFDKLDKIIEAMPFISGYRKENYPGLILS
ncbi:MAG TPA: hypothetical protein VN026_04320 [Bacteroidia bacterium]|jgi:hypothetical protein|nr:hypothetical protein [Bacteroidia bacterium]